MNGNGLGVETYLWRYPRYTLAGAEMQENRKRQKRFAKYCGILSPAPETETLQFICFDHSNTRPDPKWEGLIHETSL